MNFTNTLSWSLLQIAVHRWGNVQNREDFWLDTEVKCKDAKVSRTSRPNTGQKGTTPRNGLKDLCRESLESLAEYWLYRYKARFLEGTRNSYWAKITTKELSSEESIPRWHLEQEQSSSDQPGWRGFDDNWNFQ